MDWDPKQDAVLRAIDKWGAAISIVASISGAYNATSDSIASTTTTYTAKALMKNPTIQRESGEFGKSDRVRLLIAAKGLPTNLDELDYHVVSGSKIWHPDTTTVLNPGGTPLMFMVDMK